MLGGVTRRYHHRKDSFTMAKKAELLEKAKEYGLELTDKNTIAEIEAAIAETQAQPTVEAQITEDEREEVVAEKAEAHNAKAGKRSAKALAEAEERAEKEARKLAGDTSALDPEAEEAKKKGPKPVTRPKIERRSKKYQEAAKKIEADKLYPAHDALKLATETSTVKFDATVEVHVRLGVDPRQADQNIRATVALPNGTGKDVRVAVFAPESEHEAAKKAGADIVGDEEFLKQLDKEEINFDVLVATPQYMPKLGKYARTLGPKGLMPNPKSGTVAADVAKAVKDAKAGKVEYRVDKQGIVHLGIGKVSFGEKKLAENYDAFTASLNSQKPSSIKGTFVQSIVLSTTMGPGVKVSL